MKKNSSLNLFKRAFLNVIRTKTKSIILILTFFLIGNFVIIGLGVSNAAENAKTLTRRKMRAVVSCEIDYDEVYKYLDTLSEEEQNAFWQNNTTSLRYQDIKELVNDERVSLVQASSYSTNLYSSEDNPIKYVPIDNKAEQERQENNENMYYSGDFFLKTNLFPNCIELLEGTFSMVDGEFYSQEDINNAKEVVVITKQLAELNGIKVGDQIEFYLDAPRYIEENMNMIPDLKEEYFRITLKVKGIYDHTNVITPDREDYDYLQPYENPDNLVMMPASTLQKYTSVINKIYDDYYNSMEGGVVYNDAVATEEVAVAESSTAVASNSDLADTSSDSSDLINSIILSSVKFFLNDPLVVDDFVNENEELLPKFFYFNANNDEFKNLSKPLDTLSMYSNLIIWLVVINAIVIITLVVALTLKTREYEIGVLLSIGASKVKVIMQFFAELAIVALIGFTLSTISGSLISSKIGNTVLDYQIQRDELDKDNDNYYYDSVWNEDYFTHITLDDLVEEYDSSISPLIILEIYIMGLGIVFISTLIPALMIMRFNPKKILMNQN